MTRAFLLILAAAPAAADPCLIGTWQADNAALAAQMSAMMGQEVQSVGGTTTMTLSDGGAGRYDVDLTVAILTPDGARADVGITGDSSFDWGAAGGTFTAEGGTFAYQTRASVTIGGSTMDLGSFPVSDSDMPFGRAAGPYACTPDRLTITPEEEGSMASEWVRAG
ncbi:hypothetical protein AADZ90_016765 [Aestuariibius sp. 2305UL40-4]|uniref:hypothetical protein n=1 Tax=Aestuariibius violaceus TaxID=3234132 RepID=UPI00345EAA1E